MTKISTLSKEELEIIGNSLGLAYQSAKRAEKAAVELELREFYQKKQFTIYNLIQKVNNLELV